jgi:CheY-like chemotaxis protein
MSIVDITNVMEQAKQMQELKERAEDANMAKSTFLSNMSHEIRTPMNAIVGMTEILLREDLNDKEKEYLMNIKNSGKSLLAIINDVLDFSKIESGKMDIIPEKYDTSSMLNDLGMMFLNRIGNKNVDLLMDIDPRLPSVLYGDASRVRQVVINIVNNAIKFTEVGYVRLRIEVVDMTDDEVTIKYSVKDTGIGIKDTDIDKLFRSFEQINTRRASKQEGTGLGLSVSQKLVGLMGGVIEVESTFGAGSEFYFTLKQGILNKKPAAEIRKRSDDRIPAVTCCMGSPYRRENFEVTTSKFGLPYVPYEDVIIENKPVDYIFVDNELYSDMMEAVSSEITDEATICVLNNPMFENRKYEDALTTNRPIYSINYAQMINNEKTEVEVEDEYCLNFIAPAANILLVDDNEMNRKVAIGLLKPLLMHIDTAIDGKEAVEMVKRNKYDVVLMDHMMPVMDGIEATRAIRELDGEYYKKLPIIALTANAIMDARKSFEEAGMNGFIAKPIELNDMVALLRKFLPQEKIYKQNAEVEMSTKKESLDDIPVIDGIEIKEGVKNSGSKEMFLKMLADYYNIIDVKSSKIEKCLADDMIKDYVVEVHGLKSTSRLIGAMKMSSEFLRLENLGNDGDVETLKKDTPGVLKMYRSFKDKLRSFAEADNQNKVDAPIDELITLLDDIKHAMDEFDLEKADEAMNMLDNCKIPEECARNMELLRAYMSDVAMEDVMNICDTMAEQLKTIG